MIEEKIVALTLKESLKGKCPYCQTEDVNFLPVPHLKDVGLTRITKDGRSEVFSCAHCGGLVGVVTVNTTN